jgi:protein required for attachment to host cells
MASGRGARNPAARQALTRGRPQYRKEHSMLLKPNAMVMVADGRKMLLLRNEGDAVHPDLRVEQAEEAVNPADRDQKTDAPGRASSGVGSRQDTMDEADFHQQGKDRFAADAAAMLKQRALANDFESLIVIAPPATLGELRRHYHVEVSNRLTAELAKDLTGHPIPEIEAALLAID